LAALKTLASLLEQVVLWGFLAAAVIFSGLSIGMAAIFRAMSRSCRHTPILGHAAHVSEADDKRRAAMRARKKVHDRLKPHLAAEDDFELVTGEAHPRSGQWDFGKDGKSWFARVTPRDLRK
jgi:hypothetical protein